MKIEFLSTVAVIAPDPPASCKLYVDARRLVEAQRTSTPPERAELVQDVLLADTVAITGRYDGQVVGRVFAPEAGMSTQPASGITTPHLDQL